MTTTKYMQLKGLGMKRANLLGSLTCLTLLLTACGANDQSATVTGDSGGSGASAGSAGSGIILTGGAAGTLGTAGSGTAGSGTAGGTGTVTGDGGTLPLTPDQVTAIQTSSCAGWASEGENLPSILQLVVDTSGSMSRTAPGSTMSKWVLTHDALGTAIDSLSANTALGVLFYPNQQTNPGNPQTAPRDISACVNVSARVPIDVLGTAGSAHRVQIQSGLDAARPNGSTPTHDAYRYALINGILSYNSTLPKFMLLITDGIPTFSVNCEGSGQEQPPLPSTQAIIDEVAGALASGVRTFVIGAPGSEVGPNGADERPWLSAAARAGGTAFANCSDNGPNFCHMDMTQAPDFGAALAAGLGQITGQIDTCTYSIPPPPTGMSIDLSQVNAIVTVNGTSALVQPDTMGACTEGWQLNSSGQVVLCADTCARVRSDPNAKVELLFGCASGGIVPPPPR